MVRGKPQKVENFHLGCFHFGWYCQNALLISIKNYTKTPFWQYKMTSQTCFKRKRRRLFLLPHFFSPNTKDIFYILPICSVTFKHIGKLCCSVTFKAIFGNMIRIYLSQGGNVFVQIISSQAQSLSTVKLRTGLKINRQPCSSMGNLCERI